MPILTSKLLTTYLIFPLIGLLMMGVGLLFAKRAKLLNNKKYVIYFLIAVLVLIVPAMFGYLDYDFMPSGYIGLGLLYFVLGYYNAKVLERVFNEEPDTKFRVYLITTIFLLIVSMLFFSMVFNLVNELQYGLWASTAMVLFLFPLVFRQTYELFLNIPIEIYKIWSYNNSADSEQFEHIDYNDLRVVEIELFREESDLQPLKIKVKAPNDMPYGVWFKRMLSDYNLKSPQFPIEFSSDESKGWIFYVKPSLLLPRRYIDYEQSFHQNKIKERYTIIAKRVVEVKS